MRVFGYADDSGLLCLSFTGIKEMLIYLRSMVGHIIQCN